MKRYFNGKYIEMTEEEHSKSRERFSNYMPNRGHSRNNKDNYEERIAALEKQVAELLVKLNEAKKEEPAKEEAVVTPEA